MLVLAKAGDLVLLAVGRLSFEVSGGLEGESLTSLTPDLPFSSSSAASPAWVGACILLVLPERRFLDPFVIVLLPTNCPAFHVYAILNFVKREHVNKTLVLS